MRRICTQNSQTVALFVPENLQVKALMLFIVPI